MQKTLEYSLGCHTVKQLWDADWAQVHMTVLQGPKLRQHLFKWGCYMCLLYTTGLVIFDYIQLSLDIIYV